MGLVAMVGRGSRRLRGVGLVGRGSRRLRGVGPGG